MVFRFALFLDHAQSLARGYGIVGQDQTLAQLAAGWRGDIDGGTGDQNLGHPITGENPIARTDIPETQYGPGCAQIRKRDRDLRS